MIGRIEFPRFPDDGTKLTATLEDGKNWTCNDKEVQAFLNRRAPPVGGYFPAATQLYIGRDNLPPGAKIVEETDQTVVPDRVY